MFWPLVRALKRVKDMTIGLFCADGPLRNYSLTHSLFCCTFARCMNLKRVQCS